MQTRIVSSRINYRMVGLSLLGVLILVPCALVFADPLVPCKGVDCQSCHVVQLVQNIVNWFFKIMVPICSLIVAYAGIKMVMSGGDMGAIKDAKNMMTNVLIGFALILSAWLIVDTLMKTFVDQKSVGSAGSEGSKYGPWNVIKCVAPPGYTVTVPVTGGVAVVGGPSGPGSAATIAGAVNNMVGFSTAAGPGDGNVACAWAVNKVLAAAGVPAIDGDSVRQMEQTLQGGRGTRVDQSTAQPGDIVIVTDGSRAHTGICRNAGCTQVISNSSSNKSFSWQSGPDFKPSYNAGIGRIYRVNGGN